jgi:hypothetical protein
MAPAITVRETMIVVRRAEPVKVQVASGIATTGPPPDVALLIAAAARRARSAAAGVRPVATMNAAGARTEAAGAGTSAAPSVVVVPAGPVVRTADRSGATDRPGRALPPVSATTVVGGRTAGVALGPRAVRAIAATTAAVVSRAVASPAVAAATIGDPAATGATGATAAGTTAVTIAAATAGAGTTGPGTTGRPRDARAPTAVTAIRGGRIARTVARSVTTAVDTAIGTPPATTAVAETQPDPAVGKAARAIPRPTAANSVMIETPSGPTTAVDTATAEVNTGRTIVDTAEATAADRVTARAIGSAGTARLTQAETGRAHHADTTGTTGRGAVLRTATDRRDTGQPIGRRDTGRTIADLEARPAAPPPAMAPAVTGGGSTATGRAGTGTATSGAAGTAARTRRTEAPRAVAGPGTGTRSDGTTEAAVRRRTVPTIAVPAALTTRQGAMTRGALAAPPRRVMDPAIAMTGSGVTRGASGGPPAPLTTVGRPTGLATGPRAPRSVARRSAGPGTRLRAGIAATPTRSGSRHRRSPTT